MSTFHPAVVDRIVTPEAAQRGLTEHYVRGNPAWSLERPYLEEVRNKKFGLTENYMGDVVWCVRLPGWNIGKLHEHEQLCSSANGAAKQKCEQRQALQRIREQQLQQANIPQQSLPKAQSEAVLVHAREGTVLSKFYIDDYPATLYASAAILVKIPPFAPRLRMLQLLHQENGDSRFRNAFDGCVKGADAEKVAQQMEDHAKSLNVPGKLQPKPPKIPKKRGPKPKMKSV